MLNPWKPKKSSVRQRCSLAFRGKVAKWEHDSVDRLRSAVWRGEDPRMAWVECSKSFWYRCYLISVAAEETRNAYKWSDKQVLDLNVADFCKFLQLGLNLSQPDFDFDVSGVEVEPVIKFLRPGLISTFPDFLRAYRKRDAKKRTDFLAAADVTKAYRSLLPEPMDVLESLEQVVLVDTYRRSQSYGNVISLPNNQAYLRIQKAERLLTDDEFLYSTYKKRWIYENKPDGWPESWIFEDFQRERQRWAREVKS